METPEKCRGCGYRQTTDSLSVCGYALVTGKLRNCPVEKCPHYTKEKKAKDDD